MQEKNRSFSQFFYRTDLLADHFRVPVAALADKIGISERMLFGYRSGKYPISAKAWRKLEAAERAAGIGVAEHPPNPRAGPATLPPNSFRLQESDPDDPFAGLPPDIRAAAQAIAQAIRQDIAAELSALETRLRASLESKLDRILKSQAKP
jgi:hypothetical protein